MEKVESFDALIILLFLLPGFAGVLFYSAISEMEKQENLDKIILALAFTLISNVILALITGGKIFIAPLMSSAGREKALQMFASNLGWTTIIAILLGIGWAGIQNRGLLFWAARKIKLTHRTGAIDVWHQTFSEFRRIWVRVRFKDGKTLIGWPRYYSETSENTQLFLADAIWYFPKQPRPEGENPKPQPGGFDAVAVEGHGVLLTDLSDVLSIEYL